jgi:hypothetical protein
MGSPTHWSTKLCKCPFGAGVKLSECSAHRDTSDGILLNKYQGFLRRSLISSILRLDYQTLTTPSTQRAIRKAESEIDSQFWEPFQAISNIIDTVASVVGAAMQLYLISKSGKGSELKITLLSAVGTLLASPEFLVSKSFALIQLLEKS